MLFLYRFFRSTVLLACISALIGCADSFNPINPSQIDVEYSSDDLSIEDWSTEMTTMDSYGGYSGTVIKLAPKSVDIEPPNWDEYSRPVYYALDNYSGPYKVVVSMSVWAEKPGISRNMWAGPANIGFHYRNGRFGTFGSQAFVVPENQWTDITFSQSLDIDSDDPDRRIFMDGLNENQGLIDLTLYIRHFEVTLVPVPRNIALTFEDGPSYDTEELLDLLKYEFPDVKVTFFLVGMRIDALCPELDTWQTPQERAETKEARQALVRRMLIDGHELANHSYTHNYLGSHDPARDRGIPYEDIPDVSVFSELDRFNIRSWPLSQEAIRREIQACQDAIQRAVYGENSYWKYPRVSKFFRTPFSDLDIHSESLKDIASDLDLPIVHGRSSDDIYWLSAEEIADNIMRLSAPGAIIINHNQWGFNTIEALRILVPQLKDQGYSFVTLSEMAEGIELSPGIVYEELY